MNIIGEPVSAVTPENIQNKETTLKLIAQALLFAVYRSRGAALVNMGETPVNQQEVASRISGFHHVTIEDIIARKADLPEDKKGLVVTGYSRNLYQDKEKERTVEAFIRTHATNRGLNERTFSVLVLSDSLPNEKFLHDASLPWFNGPFQGNDSVWSIKTGNDGIKLIRHDTKTEIVREPRTREVTTWVESQTIPFNK